MEAVDVMDESFEAEILHRAQRCLTTTPTNMVVVTLEVHGDVTADMILPILVQSAEAAAAHGDDASVVFALSAAKTHAWLNEMPAGGPSGSSVIEHSNLMIDEAADMIAVCKAGTAAVATHLGESLMAELGAMVATAEITECAMAADGRIFDGHYADGITNASDVGTIAGQILNSDGSSWMFAQQFVIDWASYGGLSPDAQVDVIGRDRAAVIVPDNDERSHIRRARVFDENHANLKILRVALPYGRSTTARGREEGIYFTALAPDVEVVEQILASMFGSGHIPADHLLSHVQGIAGGYYYVPSAAELGSAATMNSGQLETPERWRVRSSNGYQYYNSNDYLHAMSTGGYEPGDPPTPRILRLIGAIVSRWRDNWYDYRDIPPIPHLRHFLDESEQHIIDESVAIRKGMAIKKSLAEVHSNRVFHQRPILGRTAPTNFALTPTICCSAS